MCSAPDRPFDSQFYHFPSMLPLDIEGGEWDNDIDEDWQLNHDREERGTSVLVFALVGGDTCQG